MSRRKLLMRRSAVTMARFFSMCTRGFVVTFVLSGFVALGVHYGAGLSEVLVPWFRVGVLFGIAYAYITYLEFSREKAKKGMSSWAADRLAWSLAPWLLLDSLVVFGVMIPFGGYAGGSLYNKYGIILSLLEMTLVSFLSGVFRGLIYARIGLPEKPGFLCLRLAEKLAGNAHSPPSKHL